MPRPGETILSGNRKRKVNKRSNPDRTARLAQELFLVPPEIYGLEDRILTTENDPAPQTATSADKPDWPVVRQTHTDSAVNLVTWQYHARQTAHLAAFSSVLAATDYLTGTPYAACFAGIMAFCHWPIMHFGRKSLSRHMRERDVQNKKSTMYLRLSEMLTDLSGRAHLRQVPPVYIHTNVKLSNISVIGNPAFLSAHRPLLRLLNQRETYMMAAHEITHIASGDLKWNMAATLVSGLASSEVAWNLGTSLISLNSSNIIKAAMVGGAVFFANCTIELSRYLTREYHADRGAVLLGHDPDAMISALQKVFDAMSSKRTARASSWRAAGFFTGLDVSCVNYLQRNRPSRILGVARKYGIASTALK